MMHWDAVLGAMFSSDESRILSWSRDYSVRLWEAAFSVQIGPAMMHDNYVSGALLTSDETRILSWSGDKTLRLWHVVTGDQIGPAMMHDERVDGALFSRDQSRILSWSTDKTLRLWDAASGQQIGPTMVHDSYVGGASLTHDDNREPRLSALSGRGKHRPQQTKAFTPQTNGICERFHKTLKNEFYDTAFRKKLYTSLHELQADLDQWLRLYNNDRLHSGKYCYGKTPMQTFLDAKPIAQEKNLSGLPAQHHSSDSESMRLSDQV